MTILSQLFKAEYGTKVKNPLSRDGRGYSQCTHCKKIFTRLGISRHWDKCKEKK